MDINHFLWRHIQLLYYYKSFCFNGKYFWWRMIFMENNFQRNHNYCKIVPYQKRYIKKYKWRGNEMMDKRWEKKILEVRVEKKIVAFLSYKWKMLSYFEELFFIFEKIIFHSSKKQTKANTKIISRPEYNFCLHK